MSLTEYSKTHLVQYPELDKITTTHEAQHWVPEEVSLSQDVEHWKTNKATPEEESLIKNILRLFTLSDVAIGQGYYDRLIPVIKNNEARMMLGSFAARERTHYKAYALLSDTLGFEEDFYFEFLEYSEMTEKYEFMTAPSGDSLEEFALYLARHMLIEGVSLFASFALLFNFDRVGLFPGMIDVVRWSCQDEHNHALGNSALFKQFLAEHPYIIDDEFKQKIYQTARDLVSFEDAFIDKCFEMGAVRGITTEEIKEYIRFIADYRLVQLGFKPNWGIERNPIPWTDALMIDSHSNLFERSLVSYQKDNLKGEWVY